MLKTISGPTFFEYNCWQITKTMEIEKIKKVPIITNYTKVQQLLWFRYIKQN